MVEHYSDVLVIGAGPAGSTAATFLARKGWRVTVLERDTHPRFHIGESLLPANMEIFDRLGVHEDIKKIGMVKRSADFTAPQGTNYEQFNFSRAKSLSYNTAYQVRRSEFDHLLLKNAEKAGASVCQGVNAFDLEFGNDHPVTVRGRNFSGEETVWRANFLIDASGRGTFIANRLGLKAQNRQHHSAAVFTHFTGAERRPNEDVGNISIYWFDHGWFWFIPLSDGATSVGAVCNADYLKDRDSSSGDLLTKSIDACPELAKRLRGATQAMPVQATGNYSYASRKMYGDNYLLIGDAYSFIDPVFSSGVFLAMFGGEKAARTVGACLRRPLLKNYFLARHSFTIRTGMKRLSWLIYRFTDPALQKMFMRPSNFFGMQDAIISLLAGDVFYKFRLTLPFLSFKITFLLTRLTNR